MSRVSLDYDENFPNEAFFWEHREQQAINGKRGQKALKELREALEALPEKRLVMGAISTVALRKVAEEMPDERPSFGNGVNVPNWVKAEYLDKCAQEGDGVCAVGAYLWYKRVQAGEDPQEAMANLPGSADVQGASLDDTAYWGRQAGLVSSLAYALAWANDETFGRCTPEERYVKFLAWLDKRIK